MQFTPLSTATVALAASCFISHPAAAESAADFYAGKTVTVVVPSGSGGSFHLYCQIVAQFIKDHLPGEPTTIVQNRPGSGGIKAANYMAVAAPKDGTVIAMIDPASVIIPMLRDVRYRPTEFGWLGSASVRTLTGAVWHTVEADTIEELKKTEVLMGSTGVGSSNYQIPHFLNEVVGTKFKIITGYKGGGAVNLAIERGEVQGRTNYYSSWTGRKMDWLRDGKLKFFFQMGPQLPQLPDVPQIRDLVKPGVERQMVQLLEVGPNVGQAFYTPPGVPRAQLTTLRDAFAKMVADPATIAEAKKRNVPLNARTYKEVEKVVADAFAAPKEVVKRLAAAIGFKK